MHYSLQLPSLECDYCELTPARGAGTGERLDRYPLEADEIVLADRASIHPRALQWAAARKVGLVVRYNSGSTPLFDSRKRRWPLLPRVRKLAPAQVRQWRVHTPTANCLLAGRLCAVAKSAEAAERARRRLRGQARRQQSEPRQLSLELAGYVLVWTNLAETTSAAEVLTLYRQRWQMELVFKRMKSLAGLGHLPKHDPESSRAWLYGKLLMALLAHKLGRCGRNFSPWGYPLP